MSIQLTWSEADPTPAVMARIERYELWRAAGASAFGMIVSLDVEYPEDFLPAVHPLEYEDDSTVGGTLYRYYVSAFDCYDRELRSNIVTLTTEDGETFFRLLEDGDLRLLEDDDVRLTEEAS